MKVMSTLRGFWNKAKVSFYSTSAMAMLAFTEFAHGEGIGAIGDDMLPVAQDGNAI